ncbi:MAG: DUF917 family protein [Boseongicola sp.]|nr:DUF917 family protein [Boseongicola sp.]
MAGSLRSLDIDHVARIASGATLLGAGGGGDPYISLLAARQIHANGGRTVDLIRLSELEDDAQVVCVAGFGAPTVEKERLFELSHLVHSIRTLEQHPGRKADALIPAEMGGFNALVPIMAASDCGLPVINGDGMGRAFPELQMTSFSLQGISASPFVMTDDHLNTVICHNKDNRKGEALARAVCMGMGLYSFLAAYPMTGREARRVAIPDTVTLAHALGGAIENAKSGASPIETLIEGIRASAAGIEAVRLFDGKVVDVWRSTERGFVIGTLLALAGIMDHFVDFLILLGIIVPPIAGVYLADYFLLRPTRINVDRDEPVPDFRWDAIAAWVLGCAVGFLENGYGWSLTSVTAIDTLLTAMAVPRLWNGLRHRL